MCGGAVGVVCEISFNVSGTGLVTGGEFETDAGGGAIAEGGCCAVMTCWAIGMCGLVGYRVRATFNSACVCAMPTHG